MLQNQQDGKSPPHPPFGARWKLTMVPQLGVIQAVIIRPLTSGTGTILEFRVKQALEMATIPPAIITTIPTIINLRCRAMDMEGQLQPTAISLLTILAHIKPWLLIAEHP